MDNNIVPTVEFGFDLTQFGGDYDYGANNYPTIHIPIDFLEKVSQDSKTTGDADWEAFEQFTGFDRVHALYRNSEDDKETGDGQTQDDLDSQEASLSALREAHYQTCSVCQRTRHTRFAKEGE